MPAEYSRPMLDVGSPRVFNCNVLTHQLLAADPAASPFFRSKPLNNVVLIKDTVSGAGREDAQSGIGTKLYFPFNENDIYEGGRTIFVHDKQLEAALVEMFGRGALAADALADDLKLLRIVDRLPSLDPFLLKDLFLNQGVTVNGAYYEVGEAAWREIEAFILKGFEPVIKAAFPDALSSDEKGRQLINTIWEARDLEALKPLIEAFRLPPANALEIFSAWKGILFYSFQTTQTKPQFIQMLTWLRDLQLPAGTTATERNTVKTGLEQAKVRLRAEWQKVDTILQEYQTAYDKIFTRKESSVEFVNFLKGSTRTYWDLGNSLGKLGQTSYCWDMMSKRFPARKMPWEQLQEFVALLDKIFKPEKKLTTGMAW